MVPKPESKYQNSRVVVEEACYLTEPGSDANSEKKTKRFFLPVEALYFLEWTKLDHQWWIQKCSRCSIRSKAMRIFPHSFVEKSFGEELHVNREHKMGIKGSSTRQVFFNDYRSSIFYIGRQNGFKI